jgi:hypothetical protein
VEAEHRTARGSLLQRPIIGGVFGSGRYVLATIPCVLRGLHAVRFMVVEPTTGAVISLADDKTEALDAARAAIRANELLVLEQAHANGIDPRQTEFWPRHRSAQRPVVDRHRPISKRRRDIFAKSHGCCHYCRITLQLEGPWHIEHMLARALGGGDDPLNLVAACVPCNLAKRDRSALEFVASRSSPSSEGR